MDCNYSQESELNQSNLSFIRSLNLLFLQLRRQDIGHQCTDIEDVTTTYTLSCNETKYFVNTAKLPNITATGEFLRFFQIWILSTHAYCERKCRIVGSKQGFIWIAHAQVEYFSNIFNKFFYACVIWSIWGTLIHVGRN